VCTNTQVPPHHYFSPLTSQPPRVRAFFYFLMYIYTGPPPPPPPNNIQNTHVTLLWAALLFCPFPAATRKAGRDDRYLRAERRTKIDSGVNSQIFDQFNPYTCIHPYTLTCPRDCQSNSFQLSSCGLEKLKHFFLPRSLFFGLKK
jgi:hypothetical protein